VNADHERMLIQPRPQLVGQVGDGGVDVHESVVCGMARLHFGRRCSSRYACSMVCAASLSTLALRCFQGARDSTRVFFGVHRGQALVHHMEGRL